MTRGRVGARRDAAGLILNGLTKLEYRGYDSWGIAVTLGAAAVVERRIGKIGSASTALPPSHAGVGHTRWATNGRVTQGNAHPHVDCTGRLAVVHNGIVANDVELRAALVAKGHRLRYGQVDTSHLCASRFPTNRTPPPTGRVPATPLLGYP